MTLPVMTRAGTQAGISLERLWESFSIPQEENALCYQDYTLTRRGGYAGDVTLTVTSVPTGLTVVYTDGHVFSGATTTLRVDFDVAADVPERPYTTENPVLATVTGAGVPNATATHIIVVYPL